MDAPASQKPRSTPPQTDRRRPVYGRATPDAGRSSLMQLIFFRSDTSINQEQAQGLARVFIAAFGTLLLLGATFWAGHDTPYLLTVGYTVAGVLYLSHVTRHKNRYLWRRYVVILLDLGLISYLAALFENVGVAYYPLFLWVMIGNGLRFGQHFMQVATLVGLIGFTAAMSVNGYLWNETTNFMGLMTGLVLMPKFFMVMIHRLSEANIELQAQKEQAEFMATHDILTGLPNRAYLQTRLEQTLARARRTGNDVAVAFIDLDSFKSINDSYGHEYGDYLLAQVAEAMRNVVRSSDTVSRLGGDEFVVVIEDYDNGARIGRVIERLFSCVGRYYTIGEYETYVTWSCGVVVFPRDGEDIHTLLKHADTAMYAAKSRGPNRYAFYDAAMSAEVGEQLALRNELRLAIERGQLEVYYQPIVDAHTGRINAAEALLRWNHPKRGILAPPSFIEVAEQSGLINPIGEWVLREALRMAAGWRAQRGAEIKVHVNVSPHQLKQAGFAAGIATTLEELRLPPQVLELEMTESALIEDAAQADQIMAALKAIGLTLALDDFGTGFSSLSYLKKLPVDTIKIDKSFIDNLPYSDREGALVEAILSIAQRLDHRIVAEGVETPEQLHWLLAQGCRYLQGYYFSRPVPRADFLALAATVYPLRATAARA